MALSSLGSEINAASMGINDFYAFFQVKYSYKLLKNFHIDNLTQIINLGVVTSRKIYKHICNPTS